MLPQKVNYGGVERLGSLDVDSMPGVGSDHPKSRDRVLGEGSVRHKARFTLATDQERRYPQVFDPFTHGDIGCCVAQFFFFLSFLPGGGPDGPADEPPTGGF